MTQILKHLNIEVAVLAFGHCAIIAAFKTEDTIDLIYWIFNFFQWMFGTIGVLVVLDAFWRFRHLRTKAELTPYQKMERYRA